MKVDMHIHSYYSDGTMSPKEIVKVAKEKGVDIISITDHNKLDSWNELRNEALKENIIAIRGVEINCKYNGNIFHLLAYGFDDNEELLKIIAKAYSEVQKMSDDLIEEMEKIDERVSKEDFETYEYNRKKGGWKGIHYLLDKGITNKLFDGFKYYKIHGCDFIEYDFPELKEVCKRIKEANGYSVLAHPGLYYKDLAPKELYNELLDLKVQGVQGIECYYPTHSKSLTNVCVDFCNEYNLLITTGSDEHGEFGKEAKTQEQTVGIMNVSINKVNIEHLINPYLVK